MNKWIFSFFIVFLIGANAFGQGGIYKTKYQKLVDFNGHNRFHGFHFAPGVTWSPVLFNDKETELYRSGDTVTTGDLTGKGKFGLYFEAGMYHLLKYGRFFRYLDWSLAYKGLKGTQDYSYTTSIENSSTTLANVEGENSFKYKFLLANVNLNNIWQITALSKIPLA
jgi:hypothetical protein